MSEETKSMDGESKNNPESAAKQEVEKADELKNNFKLWHIDGYPVENRK